ncbi:hypothetical protein [Bradyrhizobium sp. URHC0002]
MTKILSATVAIVAFAAPSFAQHKTAGQAPREWLIEHRQKRKQFWRRIKLAPSDRQAMK